MRPTHDELLPKHLFWFVDHIIDTYIIKSCGPTILYVKKRNLFIKMQMMCHMISIHPLLLTCRSRAMWRKNSNSSDFVSERKKKVKSKRIERSLAWLCRYSIRAKRRTFSISRVFFVRFHQFAKNEPIGSDIFFSSTKVIWIQLKSLPLFGRKWSHSPLVAWTRSAWYTYTIPPFRCIRPSNENLSAAF